MNRTLAFIIWIAVNSVFLTILAYHHNEYIDQEYVIRGRGKNVQVITKQENPDYYESRMKYFWTGYILTPLLSGVFIYFKIRQMEKPRTNKANEAEVKR